MTEAAVARFVSTPAPTGLHGSLRVPGDKSISHRCLLIAAKAAGTSTIRGLSPGEDVAHTMAAVGLFGAAVHGSPEAEVLVRGGALHEPERVVEVGNSGTAIRLLAGWAAGISGLTVIAGDDSVARRPMDRVVDPLRKMGAWVDGREGGRLPPLVVRGGQLQGIDYVLPVPSAQVKGALLLAGVTAAGETTVREPLPTRTHTEELLALAGADIFVSEGAVTVRRSELRPFEVEIPGDPSQAAFWIVAACVTPGSDLTVEGVYTGPARAGFLKVLERMGADLEIVETGPTTSDVRARHSRLVATKVGHAETPSLIDEIPVLAVAAAYAEGDTVFTGAGELKVKESDRISTMVAALRAVGARAEPLEDGLAVTGSGGRPLAGGEVISSGDHRVAMSMAVAGLAAACPIEIEGWEAVATSYPGFAEDYERCKS